MKVNLVPYGEDAFLPLPDEFLQRLNLKEGDAVEVEVLDDITLSVKLINHVGSGSSK